MDVVKFELKSAIGGLKETQKFDIVFFHDGKTESFAAGEPVEATRENRGKAVQFLQGITAHGTADAGDAFKLAFQQHPQLVYLLAGSDFGDNGVVLTAFRELNKQAKAKVNTISLLSKSEQDASLVELLQTIAKENHGNLKTVAFEDLRAQEKARSHAASATQPTTRPSTKPSGA